MSASPAAALAALPPLQHPDGSPIRVLVVEDEPTIADLLRFPLEMIGWRATVVGDGLEAVRLAREVRPRTTHDTCLLVACYRPSSRIWQQFSCAN